MDVVGKHQGIVEVAIVSPGWLEFFQVERDCEVGAKSVLGERRE